MWAFSPCGAISLAARLRATSAGSTCQQDITFAALNKIGCGKDISSEGHGLKSPNLFLAFSGTAKAVP